MNPESTNIIFGPPGTGKTYSLLEVVDLLLQDGFRPETIGFMAFTRKAAHEARWRAMEKFKLPVDKLPYFRTLHSLAFTQLGLNRTQVMGISDYLNLASQLGLSLTFKGLSEDGTLMGLSKGDRLFFTENMARAQKLSLRDYWELHPDEDLYWYELERLHLTLIEYKKTHGKYDFTDIIHEFIATPNLPEIDALIVDEAQDLTPLQWQMVEILANRAGEVHIAGDDDQAIFRWAGADVDRLITMPGSRQILEQSHRCPEAVQAIANVVVSRIQSRVPKLWKSRPAPGSLTYENAVEHIDMSQGTWLLLARNAFLLEQYGQHCLREGFVYDSQLGSPIRGESFACIKHWEELRRGQSVSIVHCKEIYQLMTSKVGVAHGYKQRMNEAQDARLVTMEELVREFGLTTDKVWHEALDKLRPDEVEYFISALKRGEKLLKEPRIKISTIHGVKGGEGDHVVLCPDMADRTWREYQQRPDDEHRVWYVGITRARESLHILQPQTNKFYDL